MTSRKATKPIQLACSVSILVVVLGAPAYGQSSFSKVELTPSSVPSNAPLTTWYILESDCPVTSLENNERTAGELNISAKLPFPQWGDCRVRLVSETARSKFLANPLEFLPAMAGLCPVSCHEKQPVNGHPLYRQNVDGKTYWLASAEALAKFKEAIANRDYKYIPVLGGD